MCSPALIGLQSNALLLFAISVFPSSENRHHSSSCCIFCSSSSSSIGWVLLPCVKILVWWHNTEHRLIQKAPLLPLPPPPPVGIAVRTVDVAGIISLDGDSLRCCWCSKLIYCLLYLYNIRAVSKRSTTSVLLLTFPQAHTTNTMWIVRRATGDAIYTTSSCCGWPNRLRISQYVLGSSSNEPWCVWWSFSSSELSFFWASRKAEDALPPNFSSVTKRLFDLWNISNKKIRSIDQRPALRTPDES